MKRFKLLIKRGLLGGVIVAIGIYTSIIVKAADYPSSTTTALTVDLDFNGKKISNIGDVITKGPWVDVRAFGAVGDGITNDQPAIQSAIDYARDYGREALYLPGGTYLISSLETGGVVFNLSSRGVTHVFGDGDKTIIKIANGLNPNYGFYMDGATSGTLIEKLKVDFNRSNQSSGNNYVFYIRNSTNITVRDVTIVDTRGAGFWIIEPAGETTQDIKILNNKINGTTLLSAIAVDSGRDILIDGNTVLNTSVVGIDIEPSVNNTLKNVIVSNNLIRDCQGGIQSYSGNVSHNVTIESNIIEGVGIVVVSGNAINHSVVNNIIRNPYVHGILLQSASKVLVSGNSIWNAGQENTGTYAGIKLEGASDNLIIGNLCTDNQGTKTQDYGIAEDASCDINQFVGNMVRDNGTAGILMYGANSQRIGNRAGGGESTGDLNMGGSIISQASLAYYLVTTTTTPYNLTNESVLLVDATGGAKTVVPPTTSQYVGRTFTVKKIGSTNNNVTIDPAGSATIDGASTYALTSPNRFVTFTFDGTNYFIIARY